MKLIFFLFQAVDLNDFKRQIHEYVESRMTFIAPNLSVIVGASTAAKLMGESVLLMSLFLESHYSCIEVHFIIGMP